MLTISPAALEFIRQRNVPVFVEPPPSIKGCCASIQECPPVRMGKPQDPARYVQRTVEGVTVFVPRGFPDETPLTIELGRYLWMKRLVLKGWRLI